MSDKAYYEKIVNDTLYAPWKIRSGTAVPTVDSVALVGGGVEIDAVVLYADLVKSSLLATEFDRRVAAKIVKSFLACASQLIKDNGGEITSFDGDRVMGVFLGDTKNSSAAKCALKINYVVTKIIKPKLSDYFVSVQKNEFDITHCVGIDRSTVLAVRAGIRGANDLIWVGRAPNLAARLSDIREAGYKTYISDDVFSKMVDSSKYGGSSGVELMWEPRTFTWNGQTISIHRSNWTWTP